MEALTIYLYNFYYANQVWQSTTGLPNNPITNSLVHYEDFRNTNFNLKEKKKRKAYSYNLEKEKQKLQTHWKL